MFASVSELVLVDAACVCASAHMDQPPRPPATLPPLEDVDSLIARNAPIARTRKRRSENFERCTTATTTGQYLAMGAARKDLKYDIEQGFVMVLDRAPPLAGHQWEATVPRSPPASPQSPRKRPKKVSSKALAVAAAEAREAAAAPAPVPASPPPVRTSTYLPSSSLRPEYAETPTRKQITQMIAGNESTSSSSSDSDTDEDFSPDGPPVRRASPPASSDSDSSDSDTGEDVSPAGSEVARVSQPTSAPAESDTDDEARPPARAPPRGPPVSAAVIAAAARSSEDDARPPANDDTDDDLPPPVVKQEQCFDGVEFTGPPAALSCAPRTVHKKYVGVKIDTRKETTSWSANIGVDGDTEYLGNYYSPVEAAEAYDKRARELKRPVNFPREGEEQAVPKTRRSSTGPPPAKRARTTASPAPAAAPPPKPTTSERAS